jgi:hypothetical protein
MTCGAPTASGSPCRKRPLRGSERCAWHREEAEEAVLVASIEQAAESSWRAAAWLLERRWPHRWARAGLSVIPDAPTSQNGSESLGDSLDDLTARREARRSVS